MKKLILLLLPIALYSQSGKVGINTTNPTETLDVNGKLRVRNIPQGSSTDSILVVKDGVVKKLPLSVLSSNQNKCPMLLKPSSNPHYLLFASDSSISNPANNLTINNINFVTAGNWVTGNIFYFSWTNTSGTPLNLNQVFSVNFGSMVCTYN